VEVAPRPSHSKPKQNLEDKIFLANVRTEGEELVKGGLSKDLEHHMASEENTPKTSSDAWDHSKHFMDSKDYIGKNVTECTSHNNSH
jgi:hypothetical protein